MYRGVTHDTVLVGGPSLNYFMHLKLFATLATLALPVAMFGQESPSLINPVGSNLEDVFQVNYASNLNRADGVVNVTNAGTSGRDICVNLYVFTPDEQEQACCSCRVTPNELDGFPVSFGPGNLLSNPAFGRANSVVIKLLASNPDGPAGCFNSTSNNHGIITARSSAGLITAGDLVPGMTAWATHAHPTNTTQAAITETRFEPKGLSAFEFGFLVNTCNQNLTNGSGKGLCSCPNLVGGLAKPRL